MQPLPPRPLRVAIVNDYRIVIAGVAALLEPFERRVRVVEQASRLTPVTEVDVILYDTFAKVHGDSIDLVELVHGGPAKVLLFSWNTDPGLVAQALAKGASGCIAKSAGPEEMVDAIERAFAGERIVPVDLQVDQATEPVYGGWPGRGQGLTAREAEVVALITQGLSNQEIADRCYLSINSVKTYIRTAYRKMGVSRRSQAVLWGLSHDFEPDRYRRVEDSARVVR